jgi:transcriptional regulator with XRE-family HTH domain
MITLDKIPAMLRATRAALNMSQDEFAKMVGLSRPTIARLEESPGSVRASTYLLLDPIIKKTLSELISD